MLPASMSVAESHDIAEELQASTAHGMSHMLAACQLHLLPLNLMQEYLAMPLGN